MADEQSERPPKVALTKRDGEALDEPASKRARPPERMLERFLDLQADELKLRGEELTANKEQNARTHEYALKALDAQAKDRSEERTMTTSARKWRYLLVALSVLVGAGLVGYLVHRGSEKLAEDLVKTAMAFATGGVGGYALGRRRDSKGKDDPPDSE